MCAASAVAKNLAKIGRLLQRRNRNVVVAREHGSLAPTPQHPCEVLRLPALTSQGHELAEQTESLGETRLLSRGGRPRVKVEGDGLV